MSSLINDFPKDKVCPACGIIDRFGDKWSLRVLVLLAQNGVMRFGELKKNVEGISQKMLTITLKKLESDKLLSRTIYAEIPPRVEYSLSALGQSLMKPLEALIQWTLENADEITGNKA